MAGPAWHERELAPFGMEIDVALKWPLPQGLEARLIELFERHKLLVFRNQTLSEEDQARLMALFGPVLCSKGEFREISSDGNLGSTSLTWHSDLAFTEEPFEAISLHALEVNDGQSWTAFANSATAAQNLPPELADKIAGRDAVTVISVIQTHRAVQYETPDFLPQQVRPVLFQHPRTGEQVLYISDMQTARIEGMAQNESDATLAALFAELYAEDRIYRHNWNNGDLIVWDNIAAQHSRCDLTGMHPRRMQRIVCAKKSFFDLLPQFKIGDPRISAWGSGGKELVLN